MLCRTSAALVILLAATGCGDNALPSSPGAVPTHGSTLLSSGPYTLMVTVSPTGESVCEGGFCRSMSLCFGSPPSAASFATSVQVDASGNGVMVVADAPGATFRMDLRSAGKALTGTAAGQFAEGLRQVSVSGSAAVTGSLGTAGHAAGRMDGQLSTGSYGCSNNGHGWTLTPR